MRNGAFEDVACDGRNCAKHAQVSLDWDDGAQSLDDDDEAVEEKLRYAGWIVRDDKHYCSKECAK